MKRKETCPNCGTLLQAHVNTQKIIDFWFCDVCGFKIRKGKVVIGKISIAQQVIACEAEIPQR